MRRTHSLWNLSFRDSVVMTGGIAVGGRRPWPVAVIGVVLSCYALYVDYKIETKEPGEDEFQSLCDIEQLGASCR